MTIVKIIGIAILGLVSAGILKEVKPSLAIFAGVVTGLIILFSLLDEFTGLISEFKKIAEIASVDNTLITTIIKIIGIGYLGEFTANLADDYGFPSIGKKVIDLSPFHTSLFITNLASINTPTIHHHCYEFGTTSVFICMGRPARKGNGDNGKYMPISVVMDERIATGVEYSRFFAAFLRYLRNPAVLESRLDGLGETEEDPCLAEV